MWISEIKHTRCCVKSVRQWRCSDVFIINFEHISHLFSSVSIVEFEQVNVSWVTMGMEFATINKLSQSSKVIITCVHDVAHKHSSKKS